MTLALLLAGCGEDHREATFTPSLPPGSYAISAPACASTGQKPRYPSPGYKVALFDLDGLSAHTLAVAPPTAVETLTGDGCSLAVTRSVYQNDAGLFTLRADRTHRFTPDGCALTATVDEHSYPVGRAYTTALDDSTAQDPEIPYDVASNGTGAYKLSSVDRADYDQTWAAFGCGPSDRIDWLYRVN